MRAALRFVRLLESGGLTGRAAGVNVDLYGSLALTGMGHGTDRAVVLGLLGEAPDAIDPASVEGKIAEVRSSGVLRLGGSVTVPFRYADDLHFRREQMYPDMAVVSHPNGMRFTAFDGNGVTIANEVYYSIGGGFIVSEAERVAGSATGVRSVPFPFRSAANLLATARAQGLTIAELMLANEVALLKDRGVSIHRPVVREFGAERVPQGLKPQNTRDSDGTAEAVPLTRTGRGGEEEIRDGILALWQTMQLCTQRGIESEGILPGGLNVRRRAPRLARRLETEGSKDPLAPMDWVTVYAMAVNEENAAGGRVVTAPTNGAAGVIPAIAHYYMRFVDGDAAEKQEGIVRYFLTAAAIGILYKENASISGAEVGCQGEVGVACSMAAGGLAAALGGTNDQVEHAAEIAMEHNLGMTCDPIGGLVQIPCIERNGMGAVKAINACRMAMHEAGDHKLSLDQVIATMYQTGLDMQSRYKETSLAGLALNIIEC